MCPASGDHILGTITLLATCSARFTYLFPAEGNLGSDHSAMTVALTMPDNFHKAAPLPGSQPASWQQRTHLMMFSFRAVAVSIFRWP